MHSAEHEERCLLYEAGELTGAERDAFAATLAGCAQCRVFLESIRACHRLCDAARVEPGAALDARALEGTPAADAFPGGQPRVSALAAAGMTLAFFFAAVLAVFLVRPSSEPKDIEWSDGLDDKVSAAGEALEDIASSLGASADGGDIDRELDDLEGTARNLKDQG